jgi:hypothetical protein
MSLCVQESRPNLKFLMSCLNFTQLGQNFKPITWMTMMGTLHHACDHMNLVVINRTSTLEVLGYLVLWPHELYVPKRTLEHVTLHRNINTWRVQVMHYIVFTIYGTKDIWLLCEDQRVNTIKTHVWIMIGLYMCLWIYLNYSTLNNEHKWED